MSGYADMRQAVIEAVEQAGCEPVYAEQFAASESSPRTACLDGVASCDGLLLILGARYGDPTPSGLSATEEEYQEASGRSMNIYAFVERIVREPRQDEFVSQVEDYVSGHWRKTFDSKEELAGVVEESLRKNAPMISGGNEEARASRRIDEVLGHRPPQSQGMVWLRLTMASLREDEVIDPIRFMDSGFQRSLQKIAHETEPPLLDYNKANRVVPQADRVIIEQGDPTHWPRERDIVQAMIRRDGLLSLTLNASGQEDRGRADLAEGYFLDPEVIKRRLQQGWTFCGAWWQDLDRFVRHNPLMYNVALYDIGTRTFDTPPAPPVMSISVPPEFLINPLVVLDGARKISRNDLQNLDEVERIVKMIGLHFREAQ